MYVPRPGAVPVAPLMAGLGLGERPGAFKIKYDLRQMDVERRFDSQNSRFALPSLETLNLKVGMRSADNKQQTAWGHAALYTSSKAAHFW